MACHDETGFMWCWLREVETFDVPVVAEEFRLVTRFDGWGSVPRRATEAHQREITAVGVEAPHHEHGTWSSKAGDRLRDPWPYHWREIIDGAPIEQQIERARHFVVGQGEQVRDHELQTFVDARIYGSGLCLADRNLREVNTSDREPLLSEEDRIGSTATPQINSPCTIQPVWDDPTALAELNQDLSRPGLPRRSTPIHTIVRTGTKPPEHIKKASPRHPTPYPTATTPAHSGTYVP